ncbi:hypothetical protein B5X24_HaOG213910 [Helicoverpa armigera]|uniref:Uncharacterized protein n=1 Tax=Helicoverpa armigera TaxID=29058 RepID=A0A2W1B4B5_HELAM|nr:hypothetical protein B5X24_HaOG213910 [Helicoverpa armigera]
MFYAAAPASAGVLVPVGAATLPTVARCQQSRAANSRALPVAAAVAAFNFIELFYDLVSSRRATLFTFK